jgi:hypothetical protein
MTTEQPAYQDREMLWLKPYGFTANPFAQCEASRETGLSEYFFDRFHDAIKGTSAAPQTCFVFANRGGGKTAQRVMIEKACQPLDYTSDILAVPYVNFIETIEQVGGDVQQVKLEHHVQQILTLSAWQLLQVFFRKPHLFLEMLPEDQGTLSWFLTNYGATAWSPSTLLKLLRDWSAVAPGMSFADIQQAMQERDIRRALVADFVEQPRGQMLTRLVEMKPTPIPKTLSAVHLLSHFVSLMRASQCKALYVLVDGVDELPETWDSPSALARFIRPLTHNTAITEIPHVAFKFFLPGELEPELETVLRGGRFRSYRLAWSNQDLLNILRARLKHFSGDKYDSLGVWAAADVGDEIDARLVEYAVGSPRRLIALGQDLVERMSNNDGVTVTRQDLLAVLERADIQEYGHVSPPLYLDKEHNRVLVGRRPIELTTQQVAVMRLLYEAKGAIKSKDDIATLIYQTLDGVTDQAIDSLMWRIRQKIERDPKSPQYLITERGAGYRLQNLG